MLAEKQCLHRKLFPWGGGLTNRPTNTSIKFINSFISAVSRLWRSHSLTQRSSEANEKACPTEKKKLQTWEELIQIKM